MSSPDDDSLQSLLAGGRLSGAQRDAILDRVLDEHAQAAPKRRLWVVGAAVVLPAAALIALAIGFGGSGGSEDDGSGYLAPKGNDAGALVAARCPDRPSGQCRRGDRLIFEVEGAKGGFFAAYAECSGERVWYFPTEDGKLPSVPLGSESAVLPQAARVGPEHGSGDCTLHLFVLDAPSDRASLLSGAARVSSSTTTRLTIEP
jgi:hypothetical protein